MAEQRRRMTYEEQRALRERHQTQADGQQARTSRPERTADRFTVDNYGSDRLSGAATRRSAHATRPTRSVREAGSNALPRSGQASAARSGSSREPSRTTRATQATRTTRTTRTTRDEFSRSNYGGAAATRPPLFKIAIAAALLVAVVLIVRLCSAALPINVTVNGTAYELRGAKTVETAIKTSGLPINPGDFISLSGNVLEKSAGEPFLASVNGVETADPAFGLHNGDVVNVTDGNDIVEGYTTTEESIPYDASITGWGAIHVIKGGSEGLIETHTGNVSGETVSRKTADPEDAVFTRYDPNVGNKKLVALTFDDGPSSEHTADVLDILKENGAKATFFVVGTEVEAYPDLVRRAHDEGHLICTHSYDHALGRGGGSLESMTAEEQIEEIERGRQTITDVIGEEASRLVRFPGGNVDEAMVKTLQPYVEAEFGWNIDTEDWAKPGADAIYQALMRATPGDVILCHDGGGDRSQTVEAIRRAIPELKAKGFEFVTVDELLSYPVLTG